MHKRITTLATALLLSTMASHAIAQGEPPPAGHVTGIGGIFVKSPDPKALAA